MTDLFVGAADWTLGWGLLAAAALIGGFAYALLYRLAALAGRRRPEILIYKGTLLRNSESSMRLILPLIATRLALPLAGPYLGPATAAMLRTLLAVGLVLAITWLAIRMTRIFQEVAEQRFDVGVEDNLRARQVLTRIRLLRRVIVMGISILGIGILMLQIPGFRTIGTGLLASAGLAGIIVGLAAQRPLGNLFAGIQIALTQPIRVEDAVIVENEWGWVEEITLSYVVVRLWDLRRLVLPISYFLEKPFQNWTRTTASLIGSVFLFTDYTVPVDDLRAELERIVRQTPLWDGNVCVLQVTDATERAVQLRALVSATNAPRAWDLRCVVREKLIAYLQREHPGALPRIRAEGVDAAVVEG